MKLTPKHIPFERLADMAEGRVTAEESRHESEHLRACASCSEQAAQLRHVTALMRSDASEDAPRGVLMSAVEMFRSRRAPETEPGLLRRIVAALTFDSSALTPAFGVRSGLAAPARQMLFSAGGFDVDLRLAQGGEGWTVSGQVLGPCAGGHVELAPAESEGGETRAALNELCEFTLPPVPDGSYALRLRMDDLEVEVPDLNLRA